MLVEYFGQTYEGAACDACDWCLKELERVDDPLTVAQKILSTVVRIGQSWGVGHIIDVLRGRVTDQITNRRHQELSTVDNGGAVGDLRDRRAEGGGPRPDHPRGHPGLPGRRGPRRTR